MTETTFADEPRNIALVMSDDNSAPFKVVVSVCNCVYVCEHTCMWLYVFVTVCMCLNLLVCVCTYSKLYVSLCTYVSVSTYVISVAV